MTTVTQHPARGYRTVRLPIAEADYERFMNDTDFARARLDELHKRYPELFPESWQKGYALYGVTPYSKKQSIRCRRVRVGTEKVVWTVAPVFVMPYFSARTEAVEKALFLMRFHVPCWAIAYVFGHDSMYWYRLEQGLGRFNVVGTTVKTPERLPSDLVADEKHSRLSGEKLYIATTVAGECILGASVAGAASEEALTQAYGVFADEAKTLAPEYKPKTVNADGWAATQAAWKALFPTVTVILCFLHAFLKVRDRATKALKDVYYQASERIWEAYRAPNKASFAQRLRRLSEWASEVLPESPMKDHVLDLCQKRSRFSRAYDHDNVHRTSNMVDRLMRFLDRAFFNAQYFHGTLASAEQRVRALALLWNFCPSSPQTIKKYHGQSCPAARLNKKSYSENWLENLLVSGSMNGVRRHQQKTL